MSGVPERLRNLSEREFYNTAIELRVEVLGIITSSAIPKSQRFTFAGTSWRATTSARASSGSTSSSAGRTGR